jgi:hypothetical protein
MLGASCSIPIHEISTAFTPLNSMPCYISIFLYLNKLSISGITYPYGLVLRGTNKAAPVVTGLRALKPRAGGCI